VTAAAWVCLASPLAACLLIALAGMRISARVAGYLATGATFVSFGAAVVAFFALLGEDSGERSHLTTAWTWLAAGDFEVGLQLLVDPLSVFMMLIVSGVGGLIVGYSIGYMHGDPEERRYFAYMALFVFSMLLLVQSGNFLLLLVGWGLVGLASYLLIGYHHERPSAVAAAKKAFIMNAVGDATMALAFFVLISEIGSLEFAAGFEWAEGPGSDTLVTLVALGLLGGAVAKSAQIPLHTWLPDAMEGPTPVSALIHAATMVVAGVYLLVRAHPIFEAAGAVQDVAAGIGALTLLVAGLIALVQVDIKRVIAYSTMSQIGYMFLGAGLAAYGSALFLLMAHAFFKALLFLAAGVVIHALAGEQDIRKMGGLRERLPKTYWAMLIGGLALAGIFPLAGFWSKDAILAAGLDAGAYGTALAIVGLAGAFVTGLYTFRMIFVVFGGEPSPYVREHLHTPERNEPNFWMAWTVGVLTVLSAIGGLIQIPGLWHLLSDFLDPAAEPLVEPSVTLDWITSAIAVTLGLAGILVAWWFYGARRAPVPRLAWAQDALERKFYFDELYDLAFYRPAVWIAHGLYRGFEQPLVGGAIEGTAEVAREAGREVSLAQTGYLRSYALAIMAGLAVLAVLFVAFR
jgi:NADH-quinone oxidoreductase subunit L